MAARETTRRPPSYSATLVLRTMSQGLSYGFQIMQATGFPSGTVYPLLRRLEAGGLVTSRWEDQEDSDGQGRPRRRYYELTSEGERSLAHGLERIRAQRRVWDGGTGESLTPATE